VTLGLRGSSQRASPASDASITLTAHELLDDHKQKAPRKSAHHIANGRKPIGALGNLSPKLPFLFEYSIDSGLSTYDTHIFQSPNGNQRDGGLSCASTGSQHQGRSNFPGSMPEMLFVIDSSWRKATRQTDEN
jgi:hypothetical protein